MISNQIFVQFELRKSAIQLFCSVWTNAFANLKKIKKTYGGWPMFLVSFIRRMFIFFSLYSFVFNVIFEMCALLYEPSFVSFGILFHQGISFHFCTFQFLTFKPPERLKCMSLSEYSTISYSLMQNFLVNNTIFVADPLQQLWNWNYKLKRI